MERGPVPPPEPSPVPAGPGRAVGPPAFFTVDSTEEDSRCSCRAVLEPFCFRTEVVCVEKPSPVPAGPGTCFLPDRTVAIPAGGFAAFSRRVDRESDCWCSWADAPLIVASTRLADAALFLETSAEGEAPAVLASLLLPAPPAGAPAGGLRMGSPLVSTRLPSSKSSAWTSTGRRRAEPTLPECFKPSRPTPPPNSPPRCPAPLAGPPLPTPPSKPLAALLPEETESPFPSPPET